ncbi:MAG: peptide chain release factor N(5)-glutamine methyltransferase [Gemmatimonadetes bacterium]|nr:peptide chain release factor N(5)-glutamine methyltransferase [Gemmatimonadota bacterium]
MTEAGASVDALVRAATRQLAAAGVPDPSREAWRLWADLQGELPGASLLTRDRAASTGEAERFQRAVARRVAGEPLAYVTGIAGFRRLTLKCDRRALIPRPETEGLVELVLQRQPGGVVVDVGTGSGCIALALADEGRYGAVVAVDRSPAALGLARENRDATGARVHLVLGDLCGGLAPASVHAVVSNPPYLTEAELAALEPGVRDHEPALALASGPDGLAATRRLVQEAGRVLRPGGWLALEVDMLRAPAVAALAGTAGLMDVTVHEDLFGRARYVLARRSEAE